MYTSTNIDTDNKVTQDSSFDDTVIADRTRSKIKPDITKRARIHVSQLQREQDHVSHMCISVTVPDARQTEETSQWESAMADELNSLAQNDTRKLTDLPQVSTCCQGLCTTTRIDYNETYAPVSRFESVRALISKATAEDY